jgi:PPP family 3-phenylpropionic acid transporter
MLRPVPLRLFRLRLFYFLCFGSLGLYFPFLPPWLEARGVTGFALGAVLANLPALGLVAPPLFGLLADAFGLRGYLLRVACAGAALAFGALALTPLVTGRSIGFAGLFAAIFVFAFFRAPIIPMVDVIALEEVKSGSATYPRIRIWGSIGFLITAVAAGRYIDLTRESALPLAVAAALTILVVASFGLPARAAAPPMPLRGNVRSLLQNTDFVAFLAASFLSQAAHSSYDICYSLHLRDLGLSGASTGFAWGIGVIAEVLVMALGAPLFERFRAPTLLAAAFAGASIRWILVASIKSELGLFAVQLLHACSFALMWLSSVAFVKERVPGPVLATGQGLFTASIAAGSVLGALVWGPLYHRSGGGLTFGSAAVVAALASGVAAWLARRANNQRPTPSIAAS